VVAAAEETRKKVPPEHILLVAHEFAKAVPDASTLQAIWPKAQSRHGPDWIVGRVGEYAARIASGSHQMNR